MADSKYALNKTFIRVNYVDLPWGITVFPDGIAIPGLAKWLLGPIQWRRDLGTMRIPWPRAPGIHQGLQGRGWERRNSQ